MGVDGKIIFNGSFEEMIVLGCGLDSLSLGLKLTFGFYERKGIS
jgi:hypothetical protein